jgi:hypothetical protein
VCDYDASFPIIFNFVLQIDQTRTSDVPSEVPGTNNSVVDAAKDGSVIYYKFPTETMIVTPYRLISV